MKWLLIASFVRAKNAQNYFIKMDSPTKNAAACAMLGAAILLLDSADQEEETDMTKRRYWVSPRCEERKISGAFHSWIPRVRLNQPYVNSTHVTFGPL